MFFEAVIHLLLLLLGYVLLVGALKLKSCTSEFLLGGKVTSDVPPGRTGWPLLGETLAFLQPHNTNYLGKFLQERCSRYGTVFKSHLFGRPTIVSCDLELSSFILQNEGRLFRTSYPRQIQKIIGESSMLFVHGELHKRLRGASVSFINTSKVSHDFLSYVEKLSIATMDSWKQEGRKKLHFFSEAKQLTFHFILKNVLDMESGDLRGANLLKDFLTFKKGFVSLPIYVPGKWKPICEGYEGKEKDMVYPKGIVNESTHILKEIFLKGKLNEEEQVGILIALFLGGYQTTSGLMALVVYFPARSPDSLQKVKEEHQFLRRKKKDGEPLSLDDYKQMVFTSKVINEALRCGNLVKHVFREALKDVKYKNFMIPSGWQVLPIFSSTHLDPSLHRNPFEFDPSRWDDESTSRKVMPFSGGPRLCPGAELAKLETAFFLHHFVIRFRWKIRDDECPLSYPSFDFKRDLLLDVEPAIDG